MKSTNWHIRKRAMTLVEVIGGLALLATLMASLLAVKTRVVRQSRITERRREALAAADELLNQWWQNPRTLPRSAGGALPSGLTWRTQIVPNPSATAAGGQTVRLEVFGQNGADATVELLLPSWGQ